MAGLGAKGSRAWLRRTAAWLETSDATDPALLLTSCCECQEDFKARRIKAPCILVWLVLQVLGALFQWSLLLEIWSHLTAYEATLTTYCSSEHQREGVCLGPAWNLSYSGALDFPASSGEEESDFDYVIAADRTLSFETRSAPPTFLVGVEPLEPHTGARWKLGISPKLGGPIPLTYGQGNKYAVNVGGSAMAASGQPAAWSASLTLLSQFSTAAQVHVYVVDSRIEHLEDIHKQRQCSFESSWQNFNEREMGHHHQVLFAAWRATGFFLLFSLVTTGIMLRRFLYFVEGGKLLSRLIAIKFLAQDIPQQFCIAAYLYGWYATNGLRCQMCLFHPQHCDDEHPLHFSNLMLCVFTLLSACANQLLLQVRQKAKTQRFDEDDEFFQCMIRFSLLSLSTLPFSTAMLFLSGPLLQLRSGAVYFICGLPCMVGWGTLLFLPLTVACDE